ncbi:MAG: hypothetical protein ACI8VT_002174 [Saprospiraceae bacterium]|jgi:hypothetical protein
MGRHMAIARKAQLLKGDRFACDVVIASLVMW